MDPAVFGPATLAMTQGFTAFNAFLPPLSEVRKRDVTDVEFAADVRMGELAAVGVTLGIGAITSSLTGSPVPTVVAGVMGLGLVFIYESALRANRPLEQTGDGNGLG